MARDGTRERDGDRLEPPREDERGDDDDDGDGFVNVAKLSRKQRKKAAKILGGVGGDVSAARGGGVLDGEGAGSPRRDGEQRQRDDPAGLREEPFQAPSLPRGQLVVRVDALELQARQLLERRASREEQDRHAEKLQEARRQLKASGGYTAQKLQFELLNEQKRLQRAHGTLRMQEDELQKKTDQAKELADAIATLEHDMGRVRARIEHAEHRASYLALQVGTLGQHQQDVAAVHGTMSELLELVSTGSEELRQKVESVAAYLRHIAPVFYPPEMDPVVADGADVFSNQCSDTDLDAEGLDDMEWTQGNDAGGDDDVDDFVMPSHFDVVNMDLDRLRKQKQEAVEAARARGATMLPETEAIFEEKLRVAEARVASAEALNKAAEEVQDILQRRGPKRTHRQREEDEQMARQSPHVVSPPLSVSAQAQPPHSRPGSSGDGEAAEVVVPISATSSDLDAALADGALDIVEKSLEQARAAKAQGRTEGRRTCSEGGREDREGGNSSRSGRGRSSDRRGRRLRGVSHDEGHDHERGAGRREWSRRGRLGAETRASDRGRTSTQLAIEDVSMAVMD